MQLKDLMTTHVQGIAEHQSIREAAELMDRLRVGSVPVFRDGHPIGIVTDRDIVIRAVGKGLDCAQQPVSEIMSAEPCMLSEQTSIEDAARMMEERQIRRVLVTGSNHDEIVGIVSAGDIAAKSHRQELSGELLERVSTPCEPVRETA